MSRNAQNSGSASLTPMGKVASRNFTENYFDAKLMKCLDVHTKLHFTNLPVLVGVVMG